MLNSKKWSRTWVVPVRSSPLRYAEVALREFPPSVRAPPATRGVGDEVLADRTNRIAHRTSRAAHSMSCRARA